VKILILTVAIALLTGCETQPIIDKTTEVLVEKNDQVMEISEKSLCASPLSAIQRRYGQDEELIRALLTLCGWSLYNTDVITGRW
jgi:uncharacterized lipoprotein YajG